MKEYEMPAMNLRIAQIAIVGRDPDGSHRELMRRLRQDDAIRVVAEYETLTLALAAGLGESVPADLVIVLQSYSDEFSPEEINALTGRMLFSRILCWHGPWCTADGRSHELWPVTFRVPVASAAALLELELTGLLAGDPPMFPMSAGEEVFAHRSTFLPLVEPPVRSTACVISNDFVLRDTVAEILGALQCQATVLPLAAHAGASLAGAIGLYIVAYSALSLIVVALIYPVVALFGGVSMARFAKAALPPQLIAFSSSSSLAALPALVTAAERDLVLPAQETGVVLPLASAMFKLAGPSSWTAGALFISWFYNVPLHAPQLVLLAVASVFLGFASPGIPRGAFIMLTPILIAVGLPVEGVGILIAVDAIPDTFATVLNATGNLAATAVVAKRMQ